MIGNKEDARSEGFRECLDLDIVARGTDLSPEEVDSP